MTPRTLRRHGFELAVCRLEPSGAPPSWAGGGFTAVVRTPTELSIVCERALVPDVLPADVRVEAPFAAFEVVGPLDFALVGVLAELCRVLADHGVSVFTVSTYDTDWLLVPSGSAGKAAWAFEAYGHRVIAAT